jgi:ketosteroid isomerase-like protein
MAPQHNKRAVERFYRLMNDRQFDAMWSLFADDARWGGGGTPPRTSAGIGQMRQIIVDPMPLFVDGGIHFTVHSLTAEKDRVAAEVESYAELTNGAVYNNHYHMLFFFRGDKIVEVREYGDTRHAQEVFVDSGAMNAEEMGLG